MMRSKILAMFCVFLGSLSLPIALAQNGEQQLSPQELYATLWSTVEKANIPGFDHAAWAQWQHKFDGQITSDAFALTAAEFALGSVKKPVMELYLRNFPQLPAGVGASIITTDEGLPYVINLVRSGPASMAGMKRGDVITAIDGLPSTRTLWMNALRLRGNDGTTVHVQYRRDGKLYETTLTRSAHNLEDEVVCTMIGDIAYLRFPVGRMGDQSKETVKSALSSVSASGARGLVLDLRDSNLSFDNDTQIGGYFLPEKAVLRVALMPDGTKEKTVSTQATLLPEKFPVVALINGGTVDRSELVGAQFRHYQRAKLVGDTTFGRAQSSKMYPLDREFMLSVANVDLAGPDGVSFNGVGIRPDTLISDRSLASDELPWYLNVTPGATPAPGAMNSSNQIADKQLREAMKLLSTTK